MRKTIYLGFFAWLIGNWAELTNVLGQSFMELGYRAGGDRFATGLPSTAGPGRSPWGA